MEPFEQEFQVIWADLDPNAHMRHTAYNNYAAQVRVGLFDHLSLPLAKLVASGVGVILFHEDTTFRKEVFMNEKITVDCAAIGWRKDFKIWKFRHNVRKQNGDIACTIIVTGAFMNLKERKVAPPPEAVAAIMDKVPRAEDFEWLD
jgi:acyl-CoA thioester hydrolase